MTIWTWWGHIILSLIESILSSYQGVLGKSTCCFLAYFQAIFWKVIENVSLPSTKHLETYLKLLISCFNCPLKLKAKTFWEKSIVRIFWQNIGWGGKYTPPPLPPRNRVKTTYFQYWTRLILTYIRIRKLLKQNYIEKFIEKVAFVELSTQAKHLRVWILHDDWLNYSLQYYCWFLHFQVTKV